MRGETFGRIVTIILLTTVCACHARPKPEHGLHYDTPAMVWDEAMPLGNGLLGGLVWGDGNPLNISLDRTDLWDLRPVPEFQSKDYAFETMYQWVREGRIADLHRLYDNPYYNPGPTKIPAGRILLSFKKTPTFEKADLDLAGAVATVQFRNGPSVQVFVHAVEPVGFIRVESREPVEFRLLAPSFAENSIDPAKPNRVVARDDLAALGYTAPQEARGPNWVGFLQEGWGAFRFAVVVLWQSRGDRTLAVWSIATSDDAPDPLQLAKTNCTKALSQRFPEAVASHGGWWQEFWSKSSIRVPNKIIERQWYLETYKFGAAARPDTPPITLQGPWTADNRKIPPWKGDYHHDLNTELSYWPAYSGNHLDGESGFLNWLWRTRPNAEAWTRRFFDKPGLNVPMTADLNQNQIGGWHQYTHSSTTAAWLGHHFYLHWRYSMDHRFLRERAYPWLRQTAIFLEAITQIGPDGKRTLPLSSSPEINDNRLDAWFPGITNYDLALIRFTFEKTAELADLLGESEDAHRWRLRLSEMPDFATDAEGGLLVAKGYPLKFSHRHFSHLMAIHPLGLIRWENGPRDQKIIQASLAHLRTLGSDWWTGYSFSWLASLAARARDGETAEQALEIFATAFCLRNSFHCNGDQSDKGYSKFRYRPFTLEGNFAAAAGVQEMLLQSYSGVIRLFPAIPKTWKEAAFKTLRAEGAFLVSADLKDGKIQRVEIVAEAGGVCRLENPFGTDDYVITGIPKVSFRTFCGSE